MTHVRYLVTAAVVLTVGATAPLAAQEGEWPRQGFWFNGGVGWGTSDCDACDGGRTGGGAAVLAIGGTLSQKFLLGASSNVWVDDENDVTTTLGALTAFVRFYPKRTGRFYIAAGLGVSTRSLERELMGGTFSVDENGTAILIGAGYDVRIGRSVSLTPFANAIGVDFDGEGSGFTQLGLSITVH